jgi:hypothetical protein
VKLFPKDYTVKEMLVLIQHVQIKAAEALKAGTPARSGASYASEIVVSVLYITIPI